MVQGEEELLRHRQQGNETARDALVRSYQQRIFHLPMLIRRLVLNVGISRLEFVPNFGFRDLGIRLSCSRA
jgi:hypothetical protein